MFNPINKSNLITLSNHNYKFDYKINTYTTEVYNIVVQNR